MAYPPDHPPVCQLTWPTTRVLNLGGCQQHHIGYETGEVHGITVVSGGSGYTDPTVEITGGGGSGARATATVVDGVITAFTITQRGAHYISIPTVVITDATGFGASGTAVVYCGKCNHYQNATRVYDPLDSAADLAGTAPTLPLVVPPLAGRPACEFLDCVDESATTPHIGTDGRYYGPWPGTIDPLIALNKDACDNVDPDPEQTAIHDNCYEPEYLTFNDLAACRKIGFKSVYALKHFHGRKPFIAPENDYYQMSSGGECVDVAPHLSQSSTTNTKYRTITASAIVSLLSYYGGGLAQNLSGEVESTVTVDRYSGKQTRSIEDNADEYNTIQVEMAYTLMNSYAVNASKLSLINWWTAVFANIVREGEGWTYSVTGSSAAWTISASRGDQSIDMTINLSAGTLTETYEDAGIGHWEEWSLTVGATTFSYSRDQRLRPNVLCDSGDPCTADCFACTDYHEECTVTLSDTYSSDMVNDDVNTLLATWNIKDDGIYPWRVDANTSSGPLVTYNERSQVEPTLATSVDGVPDTSLPPRVSELDGAIIGAPMQGYDRDTYFDFYHIRYSVSEGERGPLHTPESYGAYSPYLRATQWIEPDGCGLPYDRMILGRWLPSGPFAAYKTLTNPEYTDTCGTPILINPGLLKCMWMEAVLPRPSVNRARPCGAQDSDTREVSTIDCETNPEGDIRWTDAKCHCDAEATKAISGATNATPIRITTTTAHGLVDGDRIEICNVEGNTAANGSRLAVYVDTTHVDLHDLNGADVAGNGAYTTGGKLDKVSSTEAYWNWAPMQHNVTVKTWSYNFRKFWEIFRVRVESCIRKQWLYDNPTSTCGTIDVSDPTMDPWHYTEVPSNWESEADPGACPAISGTGTPILITGASETTPIVITTAGAHGLSTGALVYIVGVLGNDAANGQHIVTVTGTDTISLDDSASSGEYANGGELYSGGNVGALWLETMTSHHNCLESQACQPSRAAVKPYLAADFPPQDYPTFGTTDDVTAMPNVPCDDQYGSLWLCRLDQWITDPLWQAPGYGFYDKICDGECDYLLEDDGSCLENTIDTCYYPMRPWLAPESGTAGIEGKPALPDMPDDALPFGCDDAAAEVYVEDLDAGDAVNSACNPHYVFNLVWNEESGCTNTGYYAYSWPYATFKPWDALLKQEGCVALSGRFAAQYQANGVTDSILEVLP